MREVRGRVEDGGHRGSGVNLEYCTYVPGRPRDLEDLVIFGAANGQIYSKLNPFTSLLSHQEKRALLSSST
jgi:hypothetical protein